MADSLSTILSKGWNDFKANPILLVPGILTMVLTYLFLIAVFFSIFGSSIPTDLIINSYFIDSSFINDFDFSSVHLGNFIAISGVSLILFLILSVFLSAGLVGMGKETVVKGKTTFRDMFSYGTQYFFKLLLLTIATVVIFLSAVGIPFVLLMFIAILFVTLFSSAFGVLAFFIFYLIIMLLVLIITVLVSLSIYFATYALVIDDFDVLDSLKISYRLFMNNKLDIFAFVFVMILVSVAVSAVLQILSFALSFIPILGDLIYIVSDVVLLSVVSALTTVWSVRKYYELTRADESEDTGKPEEIETFKEEETFSEYSEIERGILNGE
ncbi:MAG: hypothetical protein RBQ94_06230 [Methanimicrococcus sp.]|nr:hypothetical protein [Methanimicrococcus sp.]